MTTLERLRRVTFLAASLALLASCGGSGGDDDDEPEPPEEEDASGLWSGTYAGTPNRMNIAVAPDGSFVGLISATALPPGNNARIIVGTGTVTAPNTVNATGTAWAIGGGTFPNGSPSATLTIAAGRVTERSSLSGSFLAGGETASFSLTYLPQSTRPASFTTLAGVYSLFPVPANGTTSTVTINTAGVATFNHSNGCTGNGNFTIIEAGLNIYRWSLSIANCPSGIPDHTVSGLGSVLDGPNGGTANFLVMTGKTSLNGPWQFNGTK